MKPFNHLKSLMVGLSALAVALPLVDSGGDTHAPYLISTAFMK